ncbi:unnamed protein product [Schistosoma curassoni]|uniref:Probable RNA-binding protein EIF1AD n=1 Tax=Schistosoma haematobium TaxID=6185 RepID=A0A095C164_SCHHA|nr:unnamed protein product [Schistosoma curassoni]CAH8433680.1 unnamed protein product [Schistosoma haematobium]
MILPSSVPKRKKAEKELFKDTHTIESNEIICKLVKSCGNYLFTAITEQGEEVFVSIPERFRNTFYFAQGGFVICSPLDSKKVKGEIRTVLQKDNIKALVNEGRWPETFTVNISKESSIKNDNYIPEDMLPSFSDSSDTESECISDNN